MSTDDDLELMFEGGELYNYLKYNYSHGADIFDIYSSEHSVTASLTDEPSTIVQSKHVSKSVMEMINEILNSQLLLEEDAVFLFQNSSDLISQKRNFVYYEVLLHGILVGFSCMGSWKQWILRKLCISVLSCSSIIFLCRVKDLFSYLNRSYKLKNIINNMQVNLSYLRKEVKLIKKEDSLISSKEKLLHLRKNENIINTYSIKQKKVEICMISKKLISILKALILLLRNTTLAILKTENDKELIGSMNCIALYSDEELGIDKDYEKLDGINLLPFIDSLINIYMMMQSETLRSIGLYLCKFTEVHEITVLFDIIHQYMFNSSTLSFLLKNLHEQHFHPTFVPKKSSRPNNKVRYLYSVMDNVSSSLNGLLIDSRNLLDFIDQNFDESADFDNNIGLKLLDMERDMACLLEYINTSSQHLLKQTTCLNVGNKSFVPHSDEKSHVTTRVSVGFSDFSVNGPDEVFLGYVNEVENLMNNDDSVDEYIKPPYLNILISELKASLAAKREDFEKREIKALKSNEDIESYKACSECNDAPSSSNNISETSIKEPTVIVTNFELNQEKTLYSSLNKDVALKAANLFKAWNKSNTEECFGDVDESDELCNDL